MVCYKTQSLFSGENFVICQFVITRPKPVGHGYVLSMTVGTRYYWGMVETGLFFVRGRTVDTEGGGHFLKTNILTVKHLKIIFWPGSLGK